MPRLLLLFSVSRMVHAYDGVRAINWLWQYQYIAQASWEEL